MSDGVFVCDICGYRQGASWGQVTFTCPRCKDTPGFVDELIKENQRLKKKVKELEDQINPPFLGEGI